MILRDFAPDDLAALLDLWQQAWQAAMPEIDFAARRPGFAGHLEGLQGAGAQLRVAVEAGGIVGFYTLDRAGYLDQLAVRRDRQGHGVAQALIADAKALSAGRIALKVNQANARAIAFYEREGFRRGEADINPVSGLPLWHYRWDADLPRRPA